MTTTNAGEPVEYEVRRFGKATWFRDPDEIVGRAQSWVNKMAAEGWRLDRYEPDKRTDDIHVVMVRPRKPATKKPASAGRRSGPL